MLPKERLTKDSIPAIGKVGIAAILAELADLEKINHVRELVAFIGLAPKETQSESSVKGNPRLCKIGPACLRKALHIISALLNMIKNA